MNIAEFLEEIEGWDKTLEIEIEIPDDEDVEYDPGDLMTIDQLRVAYGRLVISLKQ